MLAPFAPHIAEEIWAAPRPHQEPGAPPLADVRSGEAVEATMELPVQVNGKLRDKITVSADADETTILSAAEVRAKVQPWIAGKQIRKKLYVPKKLVNFVVS